MELRLLYSTEDWSGQKDCFIEMTIILCVLVKHLLFAFTFAGFWIGIYTIVSLSSQFPD